MCTYQSPSPEPKGALESVSNDSLVSYSPPALSPVSVEPYTQDKKEEEERKKHRRRKSKDKDREHKKKRRLRSKSPNEGRKKRRRHHHVNQGSPPAGREKKGGGKKPKKRRRYSNTAHKEGKVVPKSYRNPTPDNAHHRSPSSERRGHTPLSPRPRSKGRWAQDPTYDNISSPGSSYGPPYSHRSPPRYTNMYGRYTRHTPSPRGRYKYHRHRSPSPYYPPFRSPYSAHSPSPHHGRYRSPSPPPHKRYRSPPSPPMRGRGGSPFKRRERHFSPPPRGGYYRTSSPDDRRRGKRRSPSPYLRSKSPVRTKYGGDTGKIRRGSPQEERRRERRKGGENNSSTKEKTSKMPKPKSKAESASLSWDQRSEVVEKGAEEGGGKVSENQTDSGKPSVPATPVELQTTKEEEEEGEVKEVPESAPVEGPLEAATAQTVVPSPPKTAPPLPSEAPPPPPPPEEEKPPLPPVPSLPPFQPPPAQAPPPPGLPGLPEHPHEQPPKSHTPQNPSESPSGSSSPRKPSVSPISLNSSPISLARDQTARTLAACTPELLSEPLQPRGHRPRCIDAFEIVDQIGEGTYGKVSLYYCFVELLR